MFSEAKVIEAAREATGLRELGDESFRDGLGMLIRCANTEARLNDRGAAAFHSSLVFNLSNRLYIEDWYARHPEIDEQEIRQPLFGLGLPRTGSTALGCTLAEDDAVRSVRTWEAGTFSDPVAKENEFTDPRIAIYEDRRKSFEHIAPRMKTMVPVGAFTQVECHVLMALDFKAQEFVARFRLPGYVEWMLHEADLVPTYTYMKRAMKLLQWRYPPVHWRLKSPSHMPFIRALDTVFPDSRFWWTHRDIAKVWPSIVDVYHELRKGNSDQLDVEDLLSTLYKWFGTGLQRMIEFRDSGNEDRFIDVRFSDFQREPEPSIERIYAFMGEKLTDETRERMRQWRQDQAREKHGAHILDTVASALDMDEVRARFDFYTRRFADQLT